ncbi:hypothetical protein, partial [uncultured Duncaniella sp.]
ILFPMTRIRIRQSRCNRNSIAYLDSDRRDTEFVVQNNCHSTEKSRPITFSHRPPSGGATGRIAEVM